MVPVSAETTQRVISVVGGAGLSLIEANDAFRELGEWAVSTEAGDLPLHVVERRVEAEGREALRKVLQAHINSRGPGDVGPAPGVRVLDDEGGVRTCAERREAPRNVQSIFGEVVANRLAYIAPGLQAVHPLDEKLELTDPWGAVTLYELWLQTKGIG